MTRLAWSARTPRAAGKRPRRVLGTCLVAIALLPVPACGVPIGSAVHTIDPADVPSAFTAKSGASIAPPATGTQAVYFCDARGKLVGSPVRVPSTASEPALQSVLTQLTAGPSTAQTAQGLTTELPPGITLHVLAVENDQATLALGGDQLPATDQTTAIAQIVLSATSVPGISGVRLTLNGRALEAPLIDGALTTRPLAAADYRTLVRVPPSR